MMNVKFPFAGAVAVGLSFAAVSGETYTYVGGAPSAVGNSAYENAKWWKNSAGVVGKDGDPLDPSGDYISAVAMNTPNSGNAAYGAFPGASLTLKSGCSLHTYLSGKAVMTFGSKGLFLDGGAIYLEWKPQEIAGDVTVNSTLFDILNNYADTTFTLSGALHGASTAGLRFRPWFATSTGYRVRLICDCSDYEGSVTVGGASGNPPTTLELGDSLAGALTINKNSSLVLAYETNHVSVGSLTFGEGTKLVIGGRWWKENGAYKGETGRIVATDSFSMTGPVTVETGCQVIVPDGVAHKVPILTVPLGSALDKDDFVFSPCLTNCVQVGEFVVDEDEAAGTKTLCIAFEPVVLLETMDRGVGYSSATYPSSLTDATHWSDGQLPHAGAHYLVIAPQGATVNEFKFCTEDLRTRSGTVYDDIWRSDYDDEFAGDSLSLGKNVCLAVLCKKFTVKKLRLLDGGGIQKGQWVTSPTLAGNVEVVSGTAYLGVMEGSTFNIEAPVTGSGALRLPGPLTSWSSRNGVAKFSDLSGFKGRMIVMEYAEQETGAGKGHWPTYNESYQTLLVKDAKSFGGTMDALDYQGVRFGRYSRLKTTAAQVTLPASLNRGIYIDGTYGGIVYADQTDKGVPHVLEVGVPLTLNGKMVKEGPGCLKLAGPVRFGTGATETPSANKNVIEVREGSLEAASADCLDGVAMTFADATKLVVKLDPANAYGLKDVKEATPFTLTGTLTKLPIEFDTSACVGRKDETFTCGVLTVKNSSVAAVRAMLPENLSVKVHGYQRAMLKEVPCPELDATTFAFEFERGGILLIVR